ncbi:MAG: hypothetical protein WC565_07845 [Parcubacteria group bacterium]
MAPDNIEITAGSGSPVRTDLVGTAHYQVIKLDAGGDGVAVPIVAGQQTKAASLPVTLASDQGALPVSDNGGALTVDGTVAITAAALPLPSGAATSALQGGGLPAALGAGGGLKIDGSGTAVPVSVASVPSHAVTNAGTFAVQPGAALTGPGNPTIDSYASAKIDLAASSANQVLVAAPGANKQIWVYGLFMMADTAAGTVVLQDEDDTALSGTMAVSDEGGWVLPMSGNFAMPWMKVATNKALEADTGACTVDGILTYAVVSV